MNKTAILLAICSVSLLAACGGYSGMSNSSNQTPIVTGAWNMTFAPSGTQGSSPPPSTGLSVSFNQNGNSLTGTVTAVNNPPSSCFPAIATSGTVFNVTGQVSGGTGSNLNVSVAFTSGSTNGAIMGSGALAYLGTMASGTFSFSTTAAGCGSGTFTMTKVG
jgi:hypothetical protein